MRDSRPGSVAEIERFIDLLGAACVDAGLYTTLEKILSLPDAQRVALIEKLVADMRRDGAPADFVAAIACLVDTAIAEKAYEVIFNCRR